MSFLLGGEGEDPFASKQTSTSHFKQNQPPNLDLHRAYIATAGQCDKIFSLLQQFLPKSGNRHRVIAQPSSCGGDPCDSLRTRLLQGQTCAEYKHML